MTTLNKLDREISKILDKYGNYVYSDGDPRRDGIDEKEAVSQIKQSILKAIMEKKPKKKTEGILGIMGTIHRDGVENCGFNKAIEEFESVIKEVLK